MTLVSNIQPNLTAWSSSTVTLGQRASTGGNAYQVTTPGTTTAAPTGTGSSINNGGAAVWAWLSAIDYTSIAAWITAMPGTLTQALVGQVWNNGTITATTGTPIVEFKNTVTTAAFSIVLKCAPGESIRDAVAAGAPLAFDATKGVSITLPATSTANTFYCIIGTANTSVIGIQFKDPLATSASVILAMGDNFSSQTASANLIADCLFDGYGQANGTEMISYNGPHSGNTYLNNLIIDRGTTATNVRTFVQNDAALVMVGNTMVAIGTSSSTSAGFHNDDGSGGTTVFRDNVVMGWVDSSVLQGYNGNTITADNCVFSVPDFTGNFGGHVVSGSNILFSKLAANQFVSPAADFRLKTGADAIGVGVVDLTHNTVGDDFTGYIRSPNLWDMGCWQYTKATIYYNKFNRLMTPLLAQ